MTPEESPERLEAEKLYRLYTPEDKDHPLGITPLLYALLSHREKVLLEGREKGLLLAAAAVFKVESIGREEQQKVVNAILSLIDKAPGGTL